MKQLTILFALIALFTLLVACAAPATPVPTSAPTAAPKATDAPKPTDAAQAPSQPLPTAAPTALPRGGDYKIANTSDAPTLHIYKATDTASSAYTGRMFTGALWRYNPQTLEPEPAMAKAWKISNDNKTITFTLNDTKWSDGKPVTAFDYEWTFTQAMKPDNKWPYRSDPERNVVSYKAIDANTLEVTIKESKPLPVLLDKVDFITPLPKHVWEKYDWNDPTKNPEIMLPTVGNGMFTMKEWKRDNFATFVRNDNFYRGSTNLESITYRIVPNTSVSLQMLLAGEVDAASVSANDFEKAKASDLLRLYEWEPAAASWQYIGFNLRRAPGNDVEFRRAVSHAIPRDLIADKVYNKLAKPTYSTFPPTSPVYNPNVAKYDYDMKKAAELLDKAGYKLDASGKRLGKDGKPLKLKFLHNTPSPARERTAVITQDQFKQLGIEVEIVALEWAAFLNTIKKDPYDWDLDALGWSVGIEPSGIRDIWSESTIPDLNSVGYINKKQEELWEQGEKEFDPAKRKLIYQEIQKILADDAPYIFLVYNTGWTFYNKRLNVNAPTRVGVGYDFHKWFISPTSK
jgi:peptide/nickel transport system substrate-binding protein